MPDVAAVRQMVMALPDIEDHSDGERLMFKVRDGDRLAWSYLRREHPRKPRVLDPDCLAVRCAMPRKEMLVEAAPDRFFDDDHYRGYPTVLVRLAALEEDELVGLLQSAWELAQPKPKPKRTR